MASRVPCRGYEGLPLYQGNECSAEMPVDNIGNMTTGSSKKHAKDTCGKSEVPCTFYRLRASMGSRREAIQAG